MAGRSQAANAPFASESSWLRRSQGLSQSRVGLRVVTRGPLRGRLSGNTALMVLFTGGTDVISVAAAERAVAVEHRLTILTPRRTRFPALMS